MKIPVLLMTHNLGIGGSERQMVEIAKSLDRNTFQPHVGCFHSSGLRAAELHEAGVPVLRLPVTSFASPSALAGGLQLIRYIHRQNIRLVHSFDVPLNIFSAPFAWLARKPVVLTSQRAHRLLTPGLYHRLLRFSDHITSGIVVNCEFMRQHLIEEEHVPPRLIHLCYNGIDTGLFQPGPREAFPGLDGPGPIIGVVCALRPEKGLSTLVDAFGLLLPRHPSARLVIVGSGPELASLRSRALAAGISAACLFQPSTADVATWLRRFDIFVLPSLSEALSNSLMEAMACGCAVVASRVGGNVELVGAWERGLLFEAGNSVALAAAMEELIANPARRRDLASSARAFILQSFTLAVSVARMQNIYLSFLDRIPGGRREKVLPSHQS